MSAAKASSTVAAGLAPSAASASTMARERFHTVTDTPLARRLRTMAAPMAPRPTKPTFMRDPPKLET